MIDASLDDPVEEIFKQTDGLGVDVCLEAAGQKQTLLQCFDAVRTNGTVVMNGEQGAVDLSPSDHFIRRDITAVGSWYYHFGEIPAMMALHQQGLAVERLITHRFPMEQADSAFTEFGKKTCGKVLIDYQ